MLSSKTYKSGTNDSSRISASHPRSSAPVIANFASHHLTIGCGVAIFHVASKRVVVCYHSRDRYWFLPKGRRDAGEETARAAEREGFEESGYRNRILPVAIQHRQPRAHAPNGAAGHSIFSTEPVWTQLIPQSAHTQYILFWYIAETLPPDVETAMRAPSGEAAARIELAPVQQPYVAPPPYPADLTLIDRVKLDGEAYEPLRHEGTGVDEEEALYESYLLPIEEAEQKLRGTIMADVVRKGWQGILDRMAFEAAK